LEGTGSLVIDHPNQIAYVCISQRSGQSAIDKWINVTKYTPVVFTSVDGKGNPIYHTNVVMCVGEDFAVVCLDSIKNKEERENVVKHLTNTKKRIIDITLE